MVVFRTGVMPMGDMQLVHASCVQWPATVMLMFAVLRWPKPEAEGVLVGVPPLNKLAGVSNLVLDFIPSCFSLSYHGGGYKEEGGRGSSYRTIHVRPWSLISAATRRGFRCRSEPSAILILCCCISWSKGGFSEFRQWRPAPLFPPSRRAKMEAA
ncbi:hypothetical protein VPH35_045482 [Triticum aestivum]